MRGVGLKDSNIDKLMNTGSHGHRHKSPNIIRDQYNLIYDSLQMRTMSACVQVVIYASHHLKIYDRNLLCQLADKSSLQY